MYHDLRITLIIPALNEADAIGPLLAEVDRSLVDDVVVADNGSSDGTAAVAAAQGAQVVHEARRGYGSACLRAVAEARAADVLVFMDADGSDDPREIHALLTGLEDAGADLAIGSRVLGTAEAGALTPVQKFGNALTCRLVSWFWNVRYTDLGPFRAIHKPAYDRLNMSDPDFGWTVEMQVKAAQQGMSVTEVPVSCRVRRAGQSKVSGTVLGTWRAGKRILGYVLTAKAQELRHRKLRRESLVLFTRYPQPGRVKTRLIPALGDAGAAQLHRRLTEHALDQARNLAGMRPVGVEVHYTGGEVSQMRAWLGDDHRYVTQGRGDLGNRMDQAFSSAFDAGAATVVIMGSDCPDLSPAHLSRAFDALTSADLVLGPASDGGYYLIGLRRQVPQLFRDMPWGSDEVLARTTRLASWHGLRWTLLEELHDVDRPADLPRAQGFLDDLPGLARGEDGNGTQRSPVRHGRGALPGTG